MKRKKCTSITNMLLLMKFQQKKFDQTAETLFLTLIEYCQTSRKFPFHGVQQISEEIIYNIGPPLNISSLKCAITLLA